MAEGQIASPNAPYGDIFFVNTPHFDNAVNNLFEEQRMREQYRMRESFALDEMVQKEFGKIRSVDTPEVIQRYQQYKQLKKQLLFDKRAQRDPQLYNQLQREAGLALQDVYKNINRSQELLEAAKMEDQARNRQPNLYDDDYGQKRAMFWNTPLSKLSETEMGDLSNPDTYRYKGSNTDFQKLLNTAIGTPKPVFTQEEPVDKGGLQTKVTPYTFGNTPAQVKESLLGAMGMHRSGRDAEYLWDTLPQQEIENTIAQYKNIAPDKWQRMGLQGPQDLTPRNPNSKAENYASYLAMKYAINNEPRQGTPQYRNNKDAQMSQSLRDWMTKEGIRQKNREALVEMRYQKKQMDKAQEGLWLEEYMDRFVNEAANAPKGKRKDEHGNIIEEPQIPVDRILAQAFTRQIGSQRVEPDVIKIMADGKIRPIYYQYGKDGTPKRTKDGWFVVDELLSQPISRDQLKLNISKLTQSTKQRAAEMGGSEGGSQMKDATITAEEIQKKFNIRY
jgi:hypothetical protein